MDNFSEETFKEFKKLLLLKMKPSRALWAPGHKLFCVPHVLFLGNTLQLLGPSLSSKGQEPTGADQGREGMQRPRGAVRRPPCRLGAGPGSPSRDTHSNVFELFCRTEPPTDESQRDRIPDTKTFPDQGLNLCHSLDLRYSSDNARPLTAEPPGNSWPIFLM